MDKNKKKIPRHVGIIMDGNRRWAKERNLPTIEGHKRGYDIMKQMPEWFFAKGVEIVSVYAFSTENWQRSQLEVNYLMKLIKKVLSEDFDNFNKKGYRILISGELNELPGDLPELCFETIKKTRDNANGTINICLNYGGHTEIISAIKRMIKNKIAQEQVHEGIIRKYLYNGGIGDPDIIVRTSGEERLSGFMLWQSVYSELLWLKKYWPDFEKSDVETILNEYNNRNRRFGKDA